LKHANIKKIGVAVLVLLIAVCLPLGGCKKEAPATPPAPAPSPETPPEPTSHEVYFWPYTGLTTSSAVAVKTRPLSVKIENSSQARPQLGINSADIVYETMVEGMESRFNCIFQSNIPDEVGPARSARLSDLWVVPQYQGLLFFSGANSQVLGRLHEDNITLMSHDTASKLYHRVDYRRAPHNLYLDLGGAYELAAKKEIELESDTLSPLFFGQTEPAVTTTSEAIDGSAGVIESEQDFIALGAVTAGGITVPFIHDAKWLWDDEKQVYLRWTGQDIHTDAATDEQLWTDNVVIMWADYAQQTMKDPAGAPTYDTDLGKGGEAIVFRNGLMLSCTWTGARDTVPRFVTADGEEVPLKAGRTWFIVPRTGSEVSIVEGEAAEPEEKADANQ
jgi:hypothetical protein